MFKRLKLKSLRILKKFYSSKIDEYESKIYGIRTFSELVGMDFEYKSKKLMTYENYLQHYQDKYYIVSQKIKKIKRRK